MSLAILVIVASVIMLFLSQHPGHAWIKGGAVLLVLVTICAGLWAKQKNRLSLSLGFLLAGNILCSCAVLLPLSTEARPWMLDGSVFVYILSFSTRLVRLVRLVAKKGWDG